MPDDPTFPKEPTLFAEASLVSHSPKRESSKLKTTPDISGRKCLELSGNSGPLGCVEKMLLGSCDWAWTKYSLTWKAKATPRGRLIFQLARQAHPTSDNDYGLLHTPTAKANQTSPSMVNRGHGNWVSNLWPTPRAEKVTDEKEETWRKRQRKGDVSTPPLSLAVKMWPTPTAVTKEENYEVWLARMQRKTDPKSNTKTKPSDLGIAVNAVSPKTTGHLNPKWVAWLMGYPIEYLSCVPWETQSSRKSRKE